MTLFRALFYRKSAGGLLDITDGVYGRDQNEKNSVILLSTLKTKKYVKQTDNASIKKNAGCRVEGDAVLECINPYSKFDWEELKFRVRSNTTFTLMLSLDDADLAWDLKDQFSEDSKVEVHFSVFHDESDASQESNDDIEMESLEEFFETEEMLLEPDSYDGYRIDVEPQDQHSKSTTKFSTPKSELPPPPSSVDIDIVPTPPLHGGLVNVAPPPSPPSQSLISSRINSSTLISFDGVLNQTPPPPSPPPSLLQVGDIMTPQQRPIPPPLLGDLNEYTPQLSPPPLPILSNEIVSPPFFLGGLNETLPPPPPPLSPPLPPCPLGNGIVPMPSSPPSLPPGLNRASPAPPPPILDSKIVPPPPSSFLEGLNSPPPPPPPSPPSRPLGSVIVHLPPPPLPGSQNRALPPPSPCTLGRGIVPPPPPPPPLLEGINKAPPLPPSRPHLLGSGILPLPSPSLTRSLNRVPPPPPPPPPTLGSRTVPPSLLHGGLNRVPTPAPPPSLSTTGGHSASPYPPPYAKKIGGTPTSSPPPGGKSNGASPPPPPPPPRKGHSGAPPPPKGNDEAPPPPPTLKGHGGALPPPPSPPKGHGGVPPPPPPPKGHGGVPPPPPPPKGHGGVPPPPPPPKGRGGAPPPPPPPKGRGGAPPPPPPPKGHGGAPPPPPPFVAGGNRHDAPPPPRALGASPPPPESANPPRAPRCLNSSQSPLKAYRWNKVRNAMNGTLWDELQTQGNGPSFDFFVKEINNACNHDLFDYEEIKTLFSTVPSKKIDKPQVKQVPASSISDTICLIDINRATNIGIMLKKIKMPECDTMSAALAMDESILDADKVENLIKSCPTKEEMDLVKGYKGDKKKLGKPEKLFLEMMKVPRVESKLRAFNLKIQFVMQAADIRKNLETIYSACNELRKSDKLKAIMVQILFLGNKINEGTDRGSAIGFMINSLLLLTEITTKDKKITLMHFFCKEIAAKIPELINFHEELVSLESAAKISLKTVAEQQQNLVKGMKDVEIEMKASQNDGPVFEDFCKAAEEFRSTARSQAQSLVELYKLVDKNANETMIYFSEDPAKSSTEEVMCTLWGFVKSFRKAHAENIDKS